MQGSDNSRLAAKSLACRRGDRLLFKRLSFELGAGEALHVTGANGIGKTTLIRALSGLTTPFAGSIERIGDVGLLGERPALDPDLPLGRAMRFWDRLDRGNISSGAKDTLGLQPLLDVPVRYLSTGQRKRAGLAVLVNRRVPIWLLDEPLSGLDKAAIQRVCAMIAGHMQDGGIALIASHQPLDIPGLKTLALEDYVAQMDEDAVS